MVDGHLSKPHPCTAHTHQLAHRKEPTNMTGRKIILYGVTTLLMAFTDMATHLSLYSSVLTLLLYSLVFFLLDIFIKDRAEQFSKDDYWTVLKKFAIIFCGTFAICNIPAITNQTLAFSLFLGLSFLSFGYLLMFKGRTPHILKINKEERGK